MDGTKWFRNEQKDHKNQMWSVEGLRNFVGTKITSGRENNERGWRSIFEECGNWDWKGACRKILRNKNKSDITDKAVSRTRVKTTFVVEFCSLCYEDFCEWECHCWVEERQGCIPRIQSILVRSIRLELCWKIPRCPYTIPDSCQVAWRNCYLEHLTLHLSGSTQWLENAPHLLGCKGHHRR